MWKDIYSQNNSTDTHQHGKIQRFVCSNRHAVIATFSTHPQSPVTLQTLSPAQIDFPFYESTTRETIRFDSIESTRIAIFNPPWQPSGATNSKSRANRLPLLRIDNKGDDSCRFDRIDTNRNIFNPPWKPSGATNSKSRANRLPLLRIDNKGDDSCRFDRIDSNRNIFNPSSKPSNATNSKSGANRLLLLRIDNKGDDSCRFDRTRFSNRLPVSRIVNFIDESTRFGCIGQPEIAAIYFR